MKTSSAHRLVSVAVGMFTLAVAVGGFSLSVRGQQIYVSYGGKIGEFNADGTPVNASLITGLSGFWGLAVSGTNIFVSNEFGVGEYTTSGATVNAALITGLYYPNNPISLAVSGNDLFVGHGYPGGSGPGYVGEYTTSGAAVNASLIPGLDYPVCLVISGTNFFVADESRTVIGEYTTSGATVNASLIKPYIGGAGFAISGTNIFVANESGVIGEYTTSGATVNASLITGFPAGALDGLAISGNDLFVFSASTTGWVVGEYTTSGATVNASLITGSGNAYSIAVVPPGAPELQAVATNGVFQLTVSMPSPYYSTIIQASTDLVNWVNIYTNTPPFAFTDSMATNFPCRYYRALLGP